MLVDKGESYPEPQATELGEPEPYDRAARRLEDNRLHNQPEPEDGVYLGADDPVACATYPDPKARHLSLTGGDNAIVADKRDAAPPPADGTPKAKPRAKRKPKQG